MNVHSSPTYVQGIASLTWEKLPPEVQGQARRCLKDILATAAGSLSLPGPDMAARVTFQQFGSGPCPLWFKGHKSSLAGAAFFNALAVDSLDCHDGFRPNKGHAGATVVPVAVSACALQPTRGRELLQAIVIGYEVACRAGLFIHKNYAPAYHSSGSWAALGAAAAGAIVMNLAAESFDSILGASEYYAPMSPIPRCIQSPSILKDGAGAGAWSAAMALSMHQSGMRGLPSLFHTETHGKELIQTLGKDWLILQQYFKPYPTCRWTQPVVEGAKLLQQEHHFVFRDIRAIEVETFAEGAALTAFPPADSDVAQYSTPWAVAAMLVDGQLGLEQIHPRRLSDPDILGLGRRVRTQVAPDLQKRFPAECLARVTIQLEDGRRFVSPTMSARGDYADPLGDDELDSKFDQLAGPTLGPEKCRALKNVLDSLEKRPAADLLALLE